MPIPNVFIIGAMKSGTTSLYRYLGGHPDIFLPSEKDPSYFVEPEQLKKEWPLMYAKGYWQSESNYLKLYEGSENKKVIVDGSTNYTKLPRLTGVPKRIADFNPDARIIYIMRDPVERTISHYWHNLRHHPDRERRAPLQAIRQEPFYSQISDYDMQLAPYLNLFGSEQILLLTFEELKLSPVATLSKIYTWLSVDTSVAPSELAVRHNVTPEIINRAKGLGILNQFRYSKLWGVVGPRIPQTLRTLGRRFSDDAVQRTDTDLSDVIAFLRPIHKLQVERLSVTFERSFDEWHTLYGTSE